MKVRLKARALSVAVVMTTAVVIVLAVLQYRWSNELTEATGVRLADTLQLSIVNWHSDLLRNFLEVSLMMSPDPDGNAGEDLDHYVRRFREWKAVARYPDLVANVYLLQGHGDRALRLNHSANHFEPSDWPFPDALNVPAAPGAARHETFSTEAVRGWWFHPGIPALIRPAGRSASAAGGDGPSGAGALIAIALNKDVIQSHMLPDLAYRYFQGTDGLDYEVAVVAGVPPRRLVYYASDPGFGADHVPDADGTLNVFGRVPDDGASAIEVFHKTSGLREPVESATIPWFRLLGGTTVDEDWRLIVRHRRGGPLGAFVADMYRRDLAISFGALLFLMVSVAMLIVTSHRAQRLVRLQMDFVTAVSHELRTPLTVISSAADNIAQGVVEGKVQLAQYGSVIGHQAKQLSGLVEQILLFAAIDQNPQRFSLQPIEVRELIDATLATTAELVDAAHFKLEQQIEPRMPRIMGDLVALSQCLQNLMTNALKYGRQARWIGIRAEVVDRGAGGKEVQVSISDRGAGISKEDLPHIFEPFYRSPAATGAQIHGTGLGLTLAKRIAEAMKGQLTVSSEPGRGSTFTLHLPCAEEAKV